MGIVVNDLEHIDMLCVMDHRNKSILVLSLWTGEDIPSQPSEAKDTPSNEPKQRISLEVDDENWGKVLKYVVANKELGIDELLKNLRTKYKVSTKVQKALKENIA